MWCNFMNKISIGEHLSGILVLGVEGVVGKFNFFIQIFIIKFQTVDKIAINIG